MEWMNAIQTAIEYIENNLTEDITPEDVAKHVYMSPFYFQKGFGMLCGYTVAEYIRNRRLALAGGDLSTTDAKVIDITMKYGYDSPDSFTKAFTRFHGISPTMVRKDNVTIKTFAPLQLNISLKGGYIMNYKIEKKESFSVLAVSKKFEYLIADLYNPIKKIPEGFETRTIPELTWAVFSCDGPMPKALQNVNIKIYSEWLPALKEYELDKGYCIEMYDDDDPASYSNGTQDKNYHAEMWIPIKRK